MRSFFYSRLTHALAVGQRGTVRVGVLAMRGTAEEALLRAAAAAAATAKPPHPATTTAVAAAPAMLAQPQQDGTGWMAVLRGLRATRSGEDGLAAGALTADGKTFVFADAPADAPAEAVDGSDAAADGGEGDAVASGEDGGEGGGDVPDDGAGGGGEGGGGGDGGGGRCDDEPAGDCGGGGDGDPSPLPPPWTLLLRGPSLPPLGVSVSLPQAGATLLDDLRAAAAREACLIDDPSLELRRSFPPSLVAPPPAAAAAAAACTVAEAGCCDRDTLLVRGIAAPDAPPQAPPPMPPLPSSLLARSPTQRSPQPTAAAAASAGAASPSPASAGRKRPAQQRKTKFPGKARRTGVDTAAAAAAVTTGTQRQLDVAALAVAGPLAAAAAAAGFAPDISWLSPDAGGEAAGLGAALVGASRGGGGGDGGRSAAAALRAAMRSAVSVRAAEREGAARLAAATVGDAAFTILPDGRLRVEFTRTTARGGGATRAAEVHGDIPAEALPPLLAHLAQEAAEEEGEGGEEGGGAAAPAGDWMANFAPQRMAVASPRLFWAVVRHGRVGVGGRSFADALAELCPGRDWADVGVRKRARPARYAP